MQGGRALASPCVSISYYDNVLRFVTMTVHDYEAAGQESEWLRYIDILTDFMLLQCLRNCEDTVYTKDMRNEQYCCYL
jgi:hypothetical protein